MKRLIIIFNLLLVFIFSLDVVLMPVQVLANHDPLHIEVTKKPGDPGIDPSIHPGRVISNIVTIIFAFAALAVLFMLVTGAFQWITSGGDKENVGKARGRIVNALIGLAILALAFVIARVAGLIAGVNVFDLVIPPLDR